jgi:endonuclease/exonuclease/phosphatase family metal-dependent hydrolase
MFEPPTSPLRAPQRPLRLCVIFSLFFFLSLPARAQESTIVHLESQSWPDSTTPTRNPDILSFDDLVALSKTANPTGDLATRLDSLLTTPFLHEDPSAKPHRPTTSNLGPILRVAMWNIERGLNIDLIRAALTDPTKFHELTASNTSPDHAAAESQLQKLQDIDLLILNEADLGMKRTNYDNVTADLASALHMNYAYAVEFLEVDPIFDLNSEEVHLPDAQQDQRLQQDLHVDAQKYHGLHGTAILSRYPLHNVRIFRLPVCYDWYATEYAAISSLEQGKRWSAQKLFDERIERELRHGGRMALIADISVPELAGSDAKNANGAPGQATIVATHLENKCTPACRKQQMTALLDQLRSIQNPVILAGDFNTTSRDNTPTSIRNEIMKRITDYQFWVKQTISYFNPLGFAKLAVYPLHYFHGYNDPTAYHLPILWDNRERPLFKYVENFRFDDGRSFDFRGSNRRTAPPRSRTLADSNARAWKGFVPTYSFARDYGGVVGRFKLDWILVKPFTTTPRASRQPAKFAPTYPATMQELNSTPPDRISDHPPITIDLPLTEPPPNN